VTLLASVALAAPPEAMSGDPVVAAVQSQFLAPLAQRSAERGKFSRAAMPPIATRVRVLGKPQKDASGAEYVAFAVDTRRFAPDWRQAEFTGCVYTASSAVYVKRGDRFRAAADYFTRETVKPDAAICTTAENSRSPRGTG